MNFWWRGVWKYLLNAKLLQYQGCLVLGHTSPEISKAKAEMQKITAGTDFNLFHIVYTGSHIELVHINGICTILVNEASDWTFVTIF